MIEEIWYMYFTGGTEMSQSYTRQPLSRVLTRNLHVLAIGAGETLSLQKCQVGSQYSNCYGQGLGSDPNRALT